MQTNHHKDLVEIFGQPISVYTRAMAIDDGGLIDVSSAAAEAGFRFPVALTRAAWADCVAWSNEDNEREGACCQDEAGRLWDVLWIARLAARRGGSQTLFQLYRVPVAGRGIKPRLTTLKMVCSGGDEGEPVITIMRPDED